MKTEDAISYATQLLSISQPTPAQLETLFDCIPALLTEIGTLRGMGGLPIPLLLACPVCGERHIDEDEFATKPHHTHACQACGMCWRPAIVHTVGVKFLPGFKNKTTP